MDELLETVASPATGNRRWLPWLAAVGVALVVGGAVLAATVRSGGSAPGSGSGSPDLMALQGAWNVSADGEAADSVLFIGSYGRDIELFRRCGAIDGAWGATPTGLFLANVYGWSSGCGATQLPEAAWLEQAAGFTVVGDHALLLDRNGDVTASLTPATGNPPGPDWDPKLYPTPTPNAGLVKSFSDQIDLPSSLVPASSDDLVGYWVPADQPDAGSSMDSPTTPYAQFRADGTWVGSDGCNRQGGPWEVADAGVFLSVGGMQTTVGCINQVDVQSMVDDASAVGMDRDQLVFVQPDGTMSRFDPAQPGDIRTTSAG